MNVSALTNSLYNYIPVNSSQSETSSTSTSSSLQTQENIKVVDDKSIHNQVVSNSYIKNRENTLNNNSNNKEDTSYLTGEEILASRPEKSKSDSSKQLTEEEQKQIEELKSRDREVKTHEQAHIAAGGSYVLGGVSYDYQTGPDGKQYAVGGSVNIDTSPVEGDPEATIAKAQVVIKAALAPAEPSGQDQKVASAARQMMSEARKELINQQNAKINTEKESENKDETTIEIENNHAKNENNETTVNTENSTLSSAYTDISSKENKDKADNKTFDTEVAAIQEHVQNIRESNITSVKQKNNQNIAISSYNIGALISLTA